MNNSWPPVGLFQEEKHTHTQFDKYFSKFHWIQVKSNSISMMRATSFCAVSLLFLLREKRMCFFLYGPIGPSVSRVGKNSMGQEQEIYRTGSRKRLTRMKWLVKENKTHTKKRKKERKKKRHHRVKWKSNPINLGNNNNNAFQKKEKNSPPVLLLLLLLQYIIQSRQ